MIDELRKLKKVGHMADRTILRHPEGHELHIMHNSIHPQHRDILTKAPIQHFDNGGMALNLDTSAPAMMSVDPNNPNTNAPSQQAVPIEQSQVNTKEDIFNKLKQQYFNNQNTAYSGMKFGNANPNLNDEAERYAENQIKGAQDFKNNEIEQEDADYQNKLADIANRNKIRANAGLPLLDQPMAPSGVIAPPNKDTNTKNNTDVTASSTPSYADLMAQNATGNLNTLQEGLGSQIGGLGMEAQALGRQGTAEAGLQNQYANQMKQQLATFQQRSDSLEQERQNFMKDVQSNQIDPNRFINNMSTGNKVTTGIGLILGGLAGGVQHTGNQAQAYLQHQIDNDIASQKVNLGSKESLLSSNLKQFGNLKDATDMTKIMTGDLVAHQLQAEGAKAQGPLAQARAVQMAGKIIQDNAAILNQVKMRQMLFQQQGGMQQASNAFSGSDGKIDPRAMPYIIQDPKERENASKELQSAQEIDKLRNGVIGSFNDLSNKALAGSLTPAARRSDINTFGGILAKVAEGRFNLDESKQQMDAMLPAAGDLDSTKQTKMKNMMKFFGALKTTPTLDRYGIGTGVPTKFDETGNRKVNFAPVQKNR